ncbi:MAG: hypothetical protein KIS96_07960 [Bauldia sp.]|nr:hypothetical protein [Bauldia sp.]
MGENYAVTGLLVGLAFAVLDYLVLLRLIERPLREQMRQAPMAEKDRLADRMRIIRYIFLAQFIVFPVVGYIVGRMIDGSGS